MMEVSWSAAGMFLFLVEAFNVLVHISIFFRIRLLPRKDLLRVRYYFLIESTPSLITAFVYTGCLRWLISFHVLGHFFYIFFWEKTYYAKRIVNWSSLDWCQSPKGGNVEMDNILLVLFDIVMHVCNLFILSSYLSTMQIMLLVVLAKITVIAVIYNPRLAWSSPSSMPAWVQRRIKPLPSET